MVYLIMGVSGSGKTSVGKVLAKSFSISFYDADDYHNKKNIEKMKKGISLNDIDRKPWLDSLALKIKEWNLLGDSVLACSALKEDYRLILSKNNEITYIFLEGDYELIYKRLSQRKKHFFSYKMLSKQFSTLEIPLDSIKISIDQPLDEVCSKLILKLERQRLKNV